MTALELITQERQRQIEEKHFTSEHDKQHTNHELALAACYYALPKKGIEIDIKKNGDIDTFHLLPNHLFPDSWDICWMNRNETILDSIKAGALIIAEIDRQLTNWKNYPDEVMIVLPVDRTKKQNKKLAEIIKSSADLHFAIDNGNCSDGKPKIVKPIKHPLSIALFSRICKEVFELSNDEIPIEYVVPQ